MASPNRYWSPEALLARSGDALCLAAYGGFFTGMERTFHEGRSYATGQAYVEYLVPPSVTQPYPLLFIHGGGGQGLDFLCTPDGREGWAQFFVRRGFCAYVMDRTGSGRAAQHARLCGEQALPMSLETVNERFVDMSSAQTWPTASLHSRWPGIAWDSTALQFAARMGPSIGSLEKSHAHAARVAAELLPTIGPVVLVTHSLGAPWGWMFADVMPSYVKGIIAIEPYGPPFAQHATGTLTWGLTASAVPPGPANEAASGRSTFPGIPIAVVTSEASWQGESDKATVDFLRHHGARVDAIHLAALGIRGNGHAPMLETNHLAVANALLSWMSQRGLVRAGRLGRLLHLLRSAK